MAKNPPKSAAKPDKSGSAKKTAKAETPKAKTGAKPSVTSKSKTKATAAPEPKKAATKPAAVNNSTKVKSDPKKSTPAKPAAKAVKPAAEKAAKAPAAAKPVAKAKEKEKDKEKDKAKDKKAAPAKPAKAAAVAAAPKAEKEKAPAAVAKKAEPKAAAPAKKEKEKEKAAPATKVEETPAPAPAPAAKAKKEKAAAPAPVSAAKSSTAAKRQATNPDEVDIIITQAYNPAKMPPFYKKQQARLIELRSALLDSLDDVTREAIRTRPEGGDVGGMHMGDAGSDAYDRDFALSMLSKEQDALYEINEALHRLDQGVYGVCELSANKIPEERLEALPYTRYTREMQEQIERDQIGGRYRRPVVRSVFGLDDDDDGDDDDDDSDNSSGSNNDSSLDFGKD